MSNSVVRVPRPIFRIPLAHPRYVVNRRSQDVVTGSAESWANVGQGRGFALSKMRICVTAVTFRRPAPSLFSHHGGHSWMEAIMAHLVRKRFAERANNALLWGFLWSGFGFCWLGALSYDIAHCFGTW